MGDPSVSSGRSPDHIVNDDELPFRVDVEKDAPITDAPPQRRRLRRQAHDIALERIFLHRIQCRENTALVGSWNSLKRFSCGTGEKNFPVHRGVDRASHSHPGRRPLDHVGSRAARLESQRSPEPGSKNRYGEPL